MIKRHCWGNRVYYILLIILLTAGIFIGLSPSSDKQLQILIVILITSLYVGWGIVHHAIHHNITAKIVIEYILVGSLGVSAVLFVLKAL